jgi:hypothetical protein
MQRWLGGTVPGFRNDAKIWWETDFVDVPTHQVWRFEALL